MHKVRYFYSILRFVGFGDFLLVVSLWFAVKINLRKLVRFLYLRHLDYMLAFLKKQFSDVLDKYRHLESSEDFSVPRRFVSLWLQGEKDAPALVQNCFRRMRDLENVELVVLDEKGIENLGLDDVFLMKMRKGVFSRTHMSDIVRMFYLKTFGGCWADSTVFVHNLPSDFWESNLITLHHNLQVQYSEELCVPSIFESAKGAFGAKWSGFFIGSPKGSILPSLVYDLFVFYWSKFDFLVDYFLVDLFIRLGYEEIPAIRQAVDSISLNNDGSVHTLFPILNEHFDSVHWNELNKSHINVFKLSYKNFSADDSPSTYYSYIFGRK